VQAAQAARVVHQLIQRRTAVHRAANVLEGDALQGGLRGRDAREVGFGGGEQRWG
jgi:Arc/MetJ family transcription regulator